MTSDDGSKLLIDGQTVVDNDGIHAPQQKTGRVTLKEGIHRLVAGVFNGGGGCELELEIEGPGLGRQPVAGLVSLTPDGPQREAGPRAAPQRFTPDPALADKGRELFATVGCASCHQLKQADKPLASRLDAPALAGAPPRGRLPRPRRFGEGPALRGE